MSSPDKVGSNPTKPSLLNKKNNRRKYKNTALAPQHKFKGNTSNLEGYISVTPMRADLTAHDQLDVLGAALQ